MIAIFRQDYSATPERNKSYARIIKPVRTCFMRGIGNRSARTVPLVGYLKSLSLCSLTLYSKQIPANYIVTYKSTV
jgi:hypothetical protein